MKKLFIISILIFILSACSWTPKSVLPKYFRIIYINPVKNSTLEPEIGDILTRKIRTGFEIDGRLIVTEHVSKANGVLFCTIDGYKKIPISYTEKGEVDGNFLEIKMYIKLRDIKTGKWLHDNELKSSVKFYQVSEPVETELDAQGRLFDNITSKIVSKVIEGW